MGCLQSYFRKGSYDVYEAHSTGLSPSPSSAAAAAVTSAKPSTPPGSNGHAPETAEDGSPPPRPPPKKSHEAKALAAAAAAVAAAREADSSQPPALPPKRHSKASSGSQSVKLEPQPGAEPEGVKSDASPVKTEESTPGKDGEESGAVAPKDGASPTEVSTTTPPQNDTKLSEATDTSKGADSSDAVSPLKKDEVSTSPAPADRSMEESKSPGTEDAQDGSQTSTPGPMDTITPTSVVISPPEDEEGSLGERISPLEETTTSPSVEVREVTKVTPGSRPQSSGNAPEISVSPPEDNVVEDAEEDDQRPSSVTSKEIESTSVVSVSIVTDSAVAEDKDSPSEATVRRSKGGEGVGTSTDGKGRDSGLSSSEEGSTPAAVGRGDDSGQGPADETGEAREEQATESPAAVHVSGDVNKRESGAKADSSRPASTVEEKTSEGQVSVDECGNVVTEKTEGEKVVGGGAKDNASGEEVEKEKSFGFGDSASLDTVVHVKTEESTEIPNTSSQEKVASPQESTEQVVKSPVEMSGTEGDKKKSVEAAVEPTPSPSEAKEVMEEENKTAEVESPAPETVIRDVPIPPSPKEETAASPAATVAVSPPESQDKTPSPTKDDPPPPPAKDETEMAPEKEPPMSPPAKEPEPTQPQTETVSPPVTKEEPSPAPPTKEAPSPPVSPKKEAPSPPSSPKKEEVSSPPVSPKKEVPTPPPVEAANVEATIEKEPSSPSPTKETVPSPPPTETVDAPVSQTEPTPSSPCKEEKVEAVSEIQAVEKEESVAVNEETVPESPKDKSEPNSEELPPPPPPEVEKDSEQQVSEAMPPPPPPEEMVTTSAVAPKKDGSKSQERPLSATEEEVASILLAQTTADEGAKKEEKAKQEEEQKDLPPPPPSAQEGNAEEDFPPPPPDISGETEIQSPVDADGRTRSASFELVEVLNLGGSVDEGDGGAGDGIREGRGLVKRVPTPVNTDWPPSQEEEEEEEEERTSISPEATATPSVTPESKHSEEGDGAKMIKDPASGSLEGISEVTSPRGEAKEVEEAHKETVTPAAVVKEPKEIVGAQEKEKVEPEPTTSDAKVEPSAPDEEVIIAEGGLRIPGDVQVPECTVTNEGPPPEVLAALEAKLNQVVNEEDRPKSSEEVRKEVEEVGKIEVEEVIRKAVVEAERRDRESRMSGELVDQDTAAMETVVNGHVGSPEVEHKGEEVATKPEETTPTQRDTNELANHEADKHETVTPKASNNESGVVAGGDRKSGSLEEAKVDEKAGKDSPDAKTNVISKETEEKGNGVDGCQEVATDPAAVTKVKTPVKSKVDGEVNGEAEAKGRRSGQSKDAEGSDGGETIEAGGGDEERAKEEAAAIKIQSTFRGYAVRRDAGKGGGGEAGEERGLERSNTSPHGSQEADTVADGSSPSKDLPRSSEERGADPTTSGGDEEEDRLVWERLEEERRDQAASCIQRGFREFRESAGGGKRLRREDALQTRTTSSSCEAPSTSSPSFQRSSGEFHDHLVLPLIESADVLAAETGGMRQGGGVPASNGPQGDAGTRGLMDSAAARIQAGYRGYRVRKRLREVQNNGTTNHTDSPSSQSEETGEIGKEGEAATKIQAGVRGFLTRRRLKRRREDDCENQGARGRREGAGGGKSPPVGPQEAEKAALKIQAGFRGYKGRQKAKARRQQEGKKEVK